MVNVTDGFGRMNKRRVEAVIRFRKYNKESEPSNWYNEQTDLLGGYSNYEEHYRHVSTDVYANEYTKADIEDVDIDEDGPPEHLWSNIAPSAEESRAQSMAEGVEQLTEVSQQDLRDNQHQVHQPCMSGLRVPLTAKKFLLTNIDDILEN